MSTATRPKIRPAGPIDSFDSHWHEGEPLDDQAAKQAWIAFGALAALVVAAYLNMLSYTSTYWSNDLYSHGWIVPLIAGYLFWVRRRPLLEVNASYRWMGVGVIAVCLAVRLFASWIDMNPLDRLSFVGVLIGLCLLIGGRSMLVWAGPAVFFLVFMFPLPSMVENTMLMKLQNIATQISTWTLQLLGQGAVRVGNSIIIDGLEERLNVAEACSGLRMLTIFGAMSFALFLIIDRPWWDRLMILLSAVPIALVSNIVRIVATGLLYKAFPEAQTNPESTVHAIIHDGAGYAMMFIGMGLLWIELTILSHLTIPIDADEEFSAYGAVSG